ncbi:unnamed protein product, partial [Closterium sp. NIES-53]
RWRCTEWATGGRLQSTWGARAVWHSCLHLLCNAPLSLLLPPVLPPLAHIRRWRCTEWATGGRLRSTWDQRASHSATTTTFTTTCCHPLVHYL